MLSKLYVWLYKRNTVDILEKFIDHFEKIQVNIKKIFAVTTDGAAVMVGRERGFVALVEKKIGHPVMKFHCIIHQENLCAKIPNSNLVSVIATTTKIVNFIDAHSATTHRQFRSSLDEMESAHRDLPLHCTSRWLSCGKVLVNFVECLDEIKIFLSNQGKHYPELNDQKWLLDLLFLTDITIHLNELNLRLQGAGQTVLNLFETWKSFVAKLDVYIQDVQSSTFRYFKNLQKFSCDHEVNSSVIGGWLYE